MSILIRTYRADDVPAMRAIWNEVVEEGVAPQITLNEERKPVKIKITQPKRRDRKDSVS